jgi:DNA helicase II / ATP-dependent DNA helicase PcrA
MDPEVLLEGLDGAQRAAVTSTAMPLVVLAPAGSGKTRVLTRRIAHRVATGAADPRHVLALTFTRKAAGELDDRLRRLGLRGEVTTGTFHAVAWATLRTRWSDQGRAALSLLDRKGPVLRDLAPTAPGRDKRTVAGALATEIEWAKARMVTPDDYVTAIGATGRKPVVRPELVAEAYAASRI